MSPTDEGQTVQVHELRQLKEEGGREGGRERGEGDRETETRGGRETRSEKQIANELCNDITRCIYVHTQEMTLQPMVLYSDINFPGSTILARMYCQLSFLYATLPRWHLIHVCVGWEGGGHTDSVQLTLLH